MPRTEELHPDDLEALRQKVALGLTLLQTYARQLVSIGEGANPALLRPFFVEDAAALEAATVTALPTRVRNAIANLVDGVLLRLFELEPPEVVAVALLFGESLVLEVGWRWCHLLEERAAFLAVSDPEARWVFLPERELTRVLSGASNTLGMSFTLEDLAALDGTWAAPGELRRV